MKESSAILPIGKDGGRAALTSTVQSAVRGDFEALQRLHGLGEEEGVSSETAELAEAIALLMVKLEGREFQIELAAKSEDRLKELNTLKDKHLGIAAHDLRNPLASIRGMSQMMLEMDVDEKTQRSFIDSIYRVSEQMLTLVNDLLDVSAIESGGFKLTMARGNFGDLTQERAAIVETSANAKNIQLVKHIEKVSDSFFDVDRFRQVIDNLLTNAVKFSPEDSNIELSCRQTKTAIEIAVKDYGPGIPAENVERLFQAFETLDTRPTGGEKSTGLGLAIVKKIIDAHGGDITVDSEVGVGSTFSVQMPLGPDVVSEA